MSSFALAIRQRNFLKRPFVAKTPKRSHASRAVRRPIPAVGRRVGEADSRSPARRIAFVALLIAACVLAVFNSGGMVSAARDLGESRVARPLLPLAERWDGAMERIGAKQLVASVRDLMLDAQYARWSDMAELIGAGEDPMTAEMPSDDALYTGALPEGARPAEAGGH